MYNSSDFNDIYNSDIANYEAIDDNMDYITDYNNYQNYEKSPSKVKAEHIKYRKGKGEKYL